MWCVELANLAHKHKRWLWETYIPFPHAKLLLLFAGQEEEVQNIH